MKEWLEPTYVFEAVMLRVQFGEAWGWQRRGREACEEALARYRDSADWVTVVAGVRCRQRLEGRPRISDNWVRSAAEGRQEPGGHFGSEPTERWRCQLQRCRWWGRGRLWEKGVGQLVWGLFISISTH